MHRLSPSEPYPCPHPVQSPHHTFAPLTPHREGAEQPSPTPDHTEAHEWKSK